VQTGRGGELNLSASGRRLTTARRPGTSELGGTADALTDPHEVVSEAEIASSLRARPPRSGNGARPIAHGILTGAEG